MFNTRQRRNYLFCAIAMFLFSLSPVLACGSIGNECTVINPKSLTDMEDFWRTVRAGPTLDDSLSNVQAKFGKSPFDFEGHDERRGGKYVHVRIQKVYTDQVGFYTRAPVLYVDMILMEPIIDGHERQLIPIIVGQSSGGS